MADALIDRQRMSPGGVMQEFTDDFIRALAAANGLRIPDERLELVRRQYAGFVRTLTALETLPLPREAEPATFVVPAAPPLPNPGKA